jgi:hypothetical protein
MFTAAVCAAEVAALPRGPPAPNSATLPRAMIRSTPWAVAAAAYLATIYATLSVTPRLWYWLLPYIEAHVIAWVMGLSGCVAAILATKAWRVSQLRRWPALGLLVGVAVAYTVVLFVLFRGVSPGNKVHLLEYGLLGYLVCNAARVPGRGTLAAVVFLVAAGTCDELIQAVLPNRYFDLKDITGNIIGAGLGSLAWRAVSSWSPWRRPAAAA